MEERTARAISSSLEQINRSLININNRLVEIGRILKDDKEQPEDGD